MSSVLSIYCDKCGCLISQGPIAITSDRTIHDIRHGPLRTRRKPIDLCETCLRDFKDWQDKKEG
jgi:hypothetical protein